MIIDQYCKRQAGAPAGSFNHWKPVVDLSEHIGFPIDPTIFGYRNDFLYISVLTVTSSKLVQETIHSIINIEFDL